VAGIGVGSTYFTLYTLWRLCVCVWDTGQKGRIAILKHRLVSNLRPGGGLGTVTSNYSTVSDPVALDFTASSTSKLSTKSTTTVLSTGNAKALLVECWVPFTFATGGLEPYLQTRNLGFLYTDTRVIHVCKKPTLLFKNPPFCVKKKG
jgi:hypothetical protein